MQNHLRLLYGKYLDGLTEEFPQSDIMLDESGTFSAEMEAGEPGIPTIQQTSVTLRNLNENDTEQYGYDSFWEAEARTSGEGSTFPLELYIQAKIKDTTVLTGVLNGVEYDRYKETCQVNIADFLRAFKDDKRVFFKAFPINGTVWALANSDTDLTALRATDGVTAVQFEKISFLVEATQNVIAAPNLLTMNSSLANHIGANDIIFAGGSSYGTKFSDTRPAYVQIGDVTMFTKIRIELVLSNVGGLAPYQYFLFLDVFHADRTANGVITVAGKTIIEPSRFLNPDGSVITSGDAFNFTLWDYDAYGEDPDVLVKPADMPESDPFIFGCSASASGTTWTLDGTVSHAKFDILDLIQTVIDREISAQFYDTIGTDTLFDFSKVDATNYRSIFWGDAIIHGLLGATASDAIKNALAATRCYACSNPSGQIRFIPRYGFESDLAGGSYPTGTTVLQPDEFEPLDRVRYDRGYVAVEIETPVEIVPVVNVRSDEKLIQKVDQNGLVTTGNVRVNKYVPRSYRTVSSLQWPYQADIDVFGLPEYRQEPADLTLFPGTAIEQAETYMLGKSYPRRYASIQVNFEDFPLELGDFVAIENCPDVDFNGCWQVMSVTYDPTGPEILTRIGMEFRGVKST